MTFVGPFPGSASPSGTFDQGGNVREWNEEVAPGGNTGRETRGGAWHSNAFGLSRSIQTADSPGNETDFVGFRLGSIVPEPSTGLLVAGGLLSLAATRRR